MSHPSRVLIVDDDRDIRANLADILDDAGFCTVTASDGYSALEQMVPPENDQRFDLCLLDFKMPGMDGVELFEHLLKIDPQIRAIMLTAYAGEDGVQRAIDAGTWKVLRKPIDIRELLDSIKAAIADDG